MGSIYREAPTVGLRRPRGKRLAGVRARAGEKKRERGPSGLAGALAGLGWLQGSKRNRGKQARDCLLSEQR